MAEQDRPTAHIVSIAGQPLVEPIPLYPTTDGTPDPPIVRHANHETQWRYMVDAIGEATRVLVRTPPEAVEQVRHVCAERERLASKVREFFEMRDKFDAHWKHDPNCVGARFVQGQIDRLEAEMRALVAVGEEVTND